MAWTKRIAFTLWPVGQGLFTVLDSWVGSKSHRIVYDCGTFCPSQVVTDPAFTAMRNRSVDLLVVSHFHWDHISRIPQLFNSVPDIKEVWIPYLSPNQRLLFAFSTAVGGLLGGNNEPDVTEVTSMVSSGLDWFQSRGCVVQEVGNPTSETNYSENTDKKPTDELPNSDENHEYEPNDDEESDSPRALRLPPLRRLHHFFSPQSHFQAFHSTLEAVPKENCLSVDSPIELLTWIQPVDSAKEDGLITQLNAWFLTLGIKVTASDLIDQSSCKVNAKALISLVKVLGEKANRTQMKEIYIALNSDLNAGSLFLLAHPTQRYAHYRFQHTLKQFGRHFGAELLGPTSPSVLWTGDAPKAVFEKLLADGTSRFKELLGSVILHQIAHHGSKSSLSPEWVKSVGTQWNNRLCPTSVVSAGRSNHFGHPNPRVLWEYCGEVVCDGSEAFESSFEWR